MINMSPSMLVGKQLTKELINTFSGWNIRVIRPGTTMYTQEHNPYRWNLLLDENDVVKEVSKG